MRTRRAQILTRPAAILSGAMVAALVGLCLAPAVRGQSRVVVTVQELFQRDHRLDITAGTEIVWADPHFERVWFTSGSNAPRVEWTDQGFRALFVKPGTYRGAFTVVGGHRSNDVYPLVVTVTE